MYLFVYLFNRFLIIKLLIRVLITTSAGIAPSGTKGLSKPQDHFSLPSFFSLLALVWTPRTCDLPQEKAVFKHTQHSASSEWEDIFQEYKQLTLVWFWKSKSVHLLQLAWCPLHSALSQSGCFVRPSLSNGLRSIFRHVREGRTH